MTDKVYIIAEAGVNHNGNFDIAKRMIDEAVKAGVDAVKFQTFNPSALVSAFAPLAEYQKENLRKCHNENLHQNDMHNNDNLADDNSQLEMLRQLMLSKEDFSKLKQYCDEKEIEFLSTPFDLESIDFLDEIGVNKWKIPSGEITNYPYLVKIAKTHKPVIMSTGMCTLDEIETAVKVIRENGTDSLIILHCTTQYPAPKDSVNLSAMRTLGEKFNVKAGYSDHTQGIEIPIAAVAMGASVIEKHFTLDRSMEGPDHRASIEPDELRQMVESIRNVESAIGDGKKHCVSAEAANREVARKSIVAAVDIKKGTVLTEENITTKRPGAGISPMRWNEVLGTRAVKDFVRDELIVI